MAGYLNRFIDLVFPELGGVDDAGRAVVWVKIRNPRLMPAEDLLAAASRIQVDADGKPTDSAAAAQESFASFARLILAGNVWDATWTPGPDINGVTDWDAEAPLLPMPPRPEDMGRFPMEILNAVGRELTKANPPPGPAPSSTTTSP